MKCSSPGLRFFGILALISTAPVVSLSAQVLTSAVAYWDFEGDLVGTNGNDLVQVASTTSGMTPTTTPSFNPVSLPASNSGTQAVAFTGTDVLKTNDTDLRIGLAQTFWLRVNFDTIPAATTGLMSRSRTVNTQRGISLQLNATGNAQVWLSGDGTTTPVAFNDTYTLQSDTWYDISLRYDPSNVVRIDVYNPMTGLLLSSTQTTTNVPASILTTNVIGSGYFQLGSLNNGSGGSAYVAPSGTLIESAAVWSSYLSDSQIAGLSAVPEPAGVALLAGGMASFALSRRPRRNR